MVSGFVRGTLEGQHGSAGENGWTGDYDVFMACISTKNNNRYKIAHGLRLFRYFMTILYYIFYGKQLLQG